MKQAVRWLSVLLGVLVCAPPVVQAATLGAGVLHTVVLASDGTVWAWGQNQYGQLGDGTNFQRKVPTQVPGLTNIVAVSSSTYHTLALASDGTVWAWGYNFYHQIGTGNAAQTSQLVPYHLSLTNIVAIGAGNEHSVALQADRTVWTWGRNTYGQSGNGTLNDPDILAPTAASAWGSAVAISAGSAHTLVLKADGTVRAAGGNWSGELGDGSNTHQATPVTMVGITTAQAIAAGGGYSLMT